MYLNIYSPLTLLKTSQEGHYFVSLLCRTRSIGIGCLCVITTPFFLAVHSSPPSVHLMTPSFQTVMKTESVTAACVVHTPFDVKITWHLDGKEPTSTNKVNQVKEEALTSSKLTVLSSQWKTLNSITCRAQHRCFSTVEKNMSVAGITHH